MAENLNANSENVYVRKDVFEARMDRMEMLLEKTVTEIKAYVDNSINEMKAENAQLRNELKAENTQLRNELKAENAQLRKEIQDTRSELKKEIQDTRTELKIEIDGVRKDLQQTRTELKTEIRDVNNEIKVLTARVDSLEHVFYWGLGGFGIILASAVIFPAMMGFLKKIFTPSVTIEDVERIVNAAISRHLSNNMEAR